MGRARSLGGGRAAERVAGPLRDTRSSFRRGRGRASTPCASGCSSAPRSASSTPANDLFRLPIDRAFSVAGVGTVVTGATWSGRVSLGDAVVLLPGGAGGRVRSLETHGAGLERSIPGARTAVGISGLDREEARRGTVLVQAGSPWTPSSALDVEIGLEASAPRPLSARARVRLHLGTAEVMARVLPRSPIAPGESGLARLALEQPIVARGGDRFVLRSYSPVTTIGGGRVLDPIPPRRRVLWPRRTGSGRARQPIPRPPRAPPDRRVGSGAAGPAWRTPGHGRGGGGPRDGCPARGRALGAGLLAGADRRSVALDSLRRHHRAHPERPRDAARNPPAVPQGPG